MYVAVSESGVSVAGGIQNPTLRFSFIDSIPAIVNPRPDQIQKPSVRLETPIIIY